MKTNELVFSAASLWEIAIKNGLGREDFTVDARVLRRALIDNGYIELAISKRTCRLAISPAASDSTRIHSIEC
jgi:PIN domain nuclease of toxin-antitoxin system